MDIYLTASQFGKYPGLATSTSVNNCYIMLAGAEATAARAQPPGKATTLSPSKIVKSSLFEMDIYCNVFWELWSFATKNVDSFFINNVY